MITLKKNDNGIGLRAKLEDENGAVNLTDCEVLFFMDGNQIQATIEDPLGGVVAVFFDSVHTSKTGMFNAEYEVRFPDSRVETFPNNDYIKINITNDLG